MIITESDPSEVRLHTADARTSFVFVRHHSHKLRAVYHYRIVVYSPCRMLVSRHAVTAILCSTGSHYAIKVPYTE